MGAPPFSSPLPEDPIILGGCSPYDCTTQHSCFPSTRSLCWCPWATLLLALYWILASASVALSSLPISCLKGYSALLETLSARGKLLHERPSALAANPASTGRGGGGLQHIIQILQVRITLLSWKVLLSFFFPFPRQDPIAKTLAQLRLPRALRAPSVDREHCCESFRLGS